MLYFTSNDAVVVRTIARASFNKNLSNSHDKKKKCMADKFKRQMSRKKKTEKIFKNYSFRGDYFC